MILSRSSPDYKTLFFNSPSAPVVAHNLIFYSSGSCALLSALNFLNIAKGSAVLLPAYICNSVVTALKSAGFTIFFIDIKENLQLDITKVVSMIESNHIDALLVVHYFGFPCELSEISKECGKRGVVLIEDCCHSFLTGVGGDAIGRVGDAAIFSLRKTFPIEDGGALVLKDRCLEGSNKDLLMRQPGFIVYFLNRILEKMVSSSGLCNIYSPLVDSLKRSFSRIKLSDTSPLIQSMDLSRKRPSFLLNKYLNDPTYHQKIKLQVVRNYDFLSRELAGSSLRPLEPILPISCIPQWFPCVDSSEKVVTWLRKKGIGASRWPWHELPSDVRDFEHKYPVSCELDKKLALLPIHQSVKMTDLMKMSLLIDEFSRVG